MLEATSYHYSNILKHTRKCRTLTESYLKLLRLMRSSDDINAAADPRTDKYVVDRFDHRHAVFEGAYYFRSMTRSRPAMR